MSKSKKYQTDQFILVGKLQKISAKKGKVKYLKLATDEGKYWLKVAKELRDDLDFQINKGSQLKVTGQQKQYLKTGKTKFKAIAIELISEAPDKQKTKIKEKEVSLLPVFDRTKKSKAKVLVCQKSNCWKKGGKEVYAELETALSDRHLDGLIPIKKTGCLGKCKKAPNLVMLPDKVRYTQVKPKQIPNLVAKHLLSSK